MKNVICTLAFVSCVAALPRSVDWSKVSPHNIYVEPENEVDWSKVSPNNIYVEPENEVSAVGPRVIGGTEVVRNSIPYQVGLIASNGGFCGGSLISRNFVLTAAHCVSGVSSVQVILGAHRVQSSEATQVVLTSRNIVVHPQWNPNTITNDVALIRLPSTVTLNSNIQTVHLAPANAGTYAGSTALLTGWGRTSDASQSISPTLQRVHLNVITNAVCRNSFSNVQNSNICTSGSGIVGGCNGDSGGPLVVDGVQVGVVSFGSSRCQGGSPTAFARVSSFIGWIQQNSDL